MYEEMEKSIRNDNKKQEGVTKLTMILITANVELLSQQKLQSNQCIATSNIGHRNQQHQMAFSPAKHKWMQYVFKVTNFKQRASAGHSFSRLPDSLGIFSGSSLLLFLFQNALM